MKTLRFTKEINAPANRVWEILWNKDTYSKWTKHFSPDAVSNIESDWKIGGKTLFTDGKGNGMISTIKSMNEPHEMVFTHLGQVIDGTEDTTSEQVKEWAGVDERYQLTENNGITTLEASVEADEKWEAMMTNGFVKGLEEVKLLAEK